MKKRSVEATMVRDAVVGQLNAAQYQATQAGVRPLQDACSTLAFLDPVQGDAIQPVIGLVDGYLSLTSQYGQIVKSDARKVAESNPEEFENEGDVPCNRVPCFDSQEYTRALRACRQHLAMALTLATASPVEASPETPVPSPDGAVTRRAGFSTPQGDRPDRGGGRHYNH